MRPTRDAIGVGMKEFLQAIRQPPEQYPLCHQVTRNPPHQPLNSPNNHVLYPSMEQPMRSTGLEVMLAPKTLTRGMGSMLQYSGPDRMHHFYKPITADIMIRLATLMGLRNTDNVNTPTTTLFAPLISPQAPSNVIDDGYPRDKSRRSKHKGKGKAVAEDNAYDFRDERPQHGESAHSGGRDPRRPSGTSNPAAEFLPGQGASILPLESFTLLTVT